MASSRVISFITGLQLIFSAIYGTAYAFPPKLGSLPAIRASIINGRVWQCLSSRVENVAAVEDLSADRMSERSSAVLPRVAKGSTPEFAIEGDSIVETPIQRLLVVAHFILASVNLAMASAAIHIITPSELLGVVFTVMLSVIIGDFGTGVFHWSVDNYGSIKTPVFGSVCAAFQGHHVTPWTITFRSFANNVYKICYGTIPALLLLTASPLGPLSRVFFSLFITWWMVSQELHKYSHMRTTPRWVKVLQDAGVILSKKEHGLHHTSPFEGHYCILTGVCNGVLDRTNFFRFLEVVVFKLTGDCASNS
jgi:palmitoyl-[glycerolipid] 3-(E)-desaturase